MQIKTVYKSVFREPMTIYKLKHKLDFSYHNKSNYYVFYYDENGKFISNNIRKVWK